MFWHGKPFQDNKDSEDGVRVGFHVCHWPTISRWSWVACVLMKLTKVTKQPHFGCLSSFGGLWSWATRFACTHWTHYITLVGWHIQTLSHHISSKFVLIPTKDWWASKIYMETHPQTTCLQTTIFEVVIGLNCGSIEGFFTRSKISYSHLHIIRMHQVSHPSV